jgi:tetratricopeptide (TPR) repeat protein
MILYELLTGAMPFPTGTSLISVVERAIQDTEPTDPSTALTEEAATARATSVGQLRQALRGDLSSIALKALSNDRASRYESALALNADIGNYLDGRPVLARPQTAWYRAGKFLRRRWLPVAAIAFFVLGLLGATLFAIHQAQVARDEARNADAQARKAEKVSQFLNDMLSSASKLAFEPRKFTVAQMLDAAQPQLEKSWKDDPLVEATLRDSLASSYIAVQEFDKAKVQLDKALATFRSLGNRLEEAKTLLLLGYFYDATGQIEESVRHYHSALEKFDRFGKAAPNLQVFRLKRSLAYDLYAFLNRDLESARRLIAEALDIAARDGSIPKFDVVQAQSVQAAMLGDEGRTAEAETILLRALEIGRHEENGRGANVPLTGLIVLNARKRNYAAARDYAAEQYRLILRDLGPDHVDTAAAEIGWARHRAETGELREAVQQVHEAMGVLLKAFPPSSANLWSPTSGAASVLIRAGRYQEAEGYARELIAICDSEHLTEADARVAESLLRLGDALLGQHRNREAIEVLERSARDYEQAGPIWAKRAEEVRSKIREKRTRAI